jgi:hypothetical protein
MKISAQLRAEIESRSAVYHFLGIKGEPFTDRDGRHTAVGRLGYECTGNEDIEPHNRERIEVEVQIYEDPAAGWQPVAGITAVRATALALPARTGRIKRAISKAGLWARWGDRDRRAEVLAFLRTHIGDLRRRGIPPEKTRCIRSAAETCGVSESTIWGWDRAGALHEADPDLFPNGD